MSINIKSTQHFQSIVNSNSLIVLYVYAEWCSPCRSIKSEYEKLANKYNNVVFLKQNIDLEIQNPDFKVTGIPSFYFYKNGRIVLTNIGEPLNVLGPKIKALDTIVRQLL